MTGNGLPGVTESLFGRKGDCCYRWVTFQERENVVSPKVT